MNKPNKAQTKALFDQVQNLKIADRKRLAALPPEQAQAEVNALLVDLKWSVCDPNDLVWPGDLGDPAEMPSWISNDE